MRGHWWIVCGLAVLPALALGLAAGAPSAQEITLASLLGEMGDLERLTRMPDPLYKTVQFSSYDRRSTTPDAPGWFSNSDGFGNEPIPGVAEVLEKAGENGVGRYLLCDVPGPGVLVRGWTASINGDVKVWLDGKKAPVFVGTADAFMRRRLAHYLGRHDLKVEGIRAIQQEDADYFPMPFARGLRIEWTGKLKALHFYQIGVRLYPEGTKIRSFRPEDVKTHIEAIRRTATQLLAPAPWGPEVCSEAGIGLGDPGPTQNWTHGHTIEAKASDPGGRAVRRIAFKPEAHDERLAAALRSVVLRIWFDDASVPQVEAPLGDFFGAAPGINPYRSLPMEVRLNGEMVCRFVMPFRKRCRIALENTGPVALKGNLRVETVPYDWDEARSMHFRARWRVNHGILAGHAETEVTDMPFVIAQGQGRYVGSSLTLMNPALAPSAWGNWWGEGDEKVFVDGEARPSTFGTGTEDYFNYSWSRSHLFAYPYTVQPNVTGPDHRGYVTNIRWHVLDDLPFASRLEFLIELWHHVSTPGLSYARIGYHYGRPGLRDDVPPLNLAEADLRVPPLPGWSPIATLGSANAIFYPAEKLAVKADGETGNVASTMWADGWAVRWQPAASGAKLNLDFEVARTARYRVVLTCGCAPVGGEFRVLLDGKPLPKGEKGVLEIDTTTKYHLRARNFPCDPLEIAEGKHTLTFVAEGDTPGDLVLDFFWLKP